MTELSSMSRRAVFGAAAAAALLAAGCVQSSRDTGGTQSSTGGSAAPGATTAKKGGTFVFAASSDPKTLDPTYATDGESFRVARSIFSPWMAMATLMTFSHASPKTRWWRSTRFTSWFSAARMASALVGLSAPMPR